jgi:hypothetical protein
MIKPELAESLSEIQYSPPKTIANKFVNQIHHVEETEGIRKIVLNDTDMMQSLPGDVGALMQQMAGVNQAASGTATADPSLAGLPPEAAALMQQMLAQKKVEEDPNAGQGMVRKRPDYLEKAIQEVKARDRMEIDIEGSSVLDLFINLSTKKNVINTLKTISKANYEENEQEQIFYYTDVGISFYFDENGVINEIEFDEKYRKQTTKGLKIGDPIEKAIELYGPPRMKSAKGAIWNRFSVIMRDRENEIKLLRLKVRE